MCIKKIKVSYPFLWHVETNWQFRIISAWFIFRRLNGPYRRIVLQMCCPNFLFFQLICERNYFNIGSGEAGVVTTFLRKFSHYKYIKNIHKYIETCNVMYCVCPKYDIIHYILLSLMLVTNCLK